MRRIPALLIGAGLAMSSTTALADDHPRSPSIPSDTTQNQQQARLGVMVMSLTPELRTHFGAQDDRGVIVARVEPRSPAASAGIAVGDVIVEVRDHTVGEAEDVLSALASTRQGDSVPVKIVRDHRPMTLQVKLTRTQTSFLDAPLRDWLRSFPFGNSDG